jgi:hypothetical protein
MIDKTKITIIGIVIISLISAYGLYSISADYFSDERFYFSKFEAVTLRKAPKSASIIRSFKSSPDLFGDYGTAVLFSVSQNDYIALLTDLTTDTRMTKIDLSSFLGSEEFNDAMGSLKREQIVHCFERSVEGRNDIFLQIGFLDDKMKIIITFNTI